MDYSGVRAPHAAAFRCNRLTGFHNRARARRRSCAPGIDTIPGRRSPRSPRTRGRSHAARVAEHRVRRGALVRDGRAAARLPRSADVDVPRGTRRRERRRADRALLRHRPAIRRPDGHVRRLPEPRADLRRLFPAARPVAPPRARHPRSRDRGDGPGHVRRRRGLLRRVPRPVQPLDLRSRLRRPQRHRPDDLEDVSRDPARRRSSSALSAALIWAGRRAGRALDGTRRALPSDSGGVAPRRSPGRARLPRDHGSLGRRPVQIKDAAVTPIRT